MKIKKYKNFIVILIVLVIGFLIGFFTKSIVFTEKLEEKSDTLVASSFTSKIKDSQYNTEAINELTAELEELEKRLEEINSEKRDIEAKISTLKNRINNSTNQEFETEIFSEEEN